ncbi:hypothetical protein CLOM_g15334 [Closterium sp. NIES-68]|nr:hypothetical protein CLOM_g15334 [Closterium sp. NIES-68]GJP61360.1 hypothetical protein CLOP_g18531 [Closterium sp. NIES-67]
MASQAVPIPGVSDDFFRPLHPANAALPFAAELDPADGAVDDGDIHAAINSFLALPNSFWDSSLPPFLAVDPSPTQESADAAAEAPRGAADKSGAKRKPRGDASGGETTQAVRGCETKIQNASSTKMLEDSEGTEQQQQSHGRKDSESDSLSRREPKQPPTWRGGSNSKKQRQQQRRHKATQQNAKILSALLTALASLDDLCPANGDAASDDSAPTTPPSAKRRKACGGGKPDLVTDGDCDGASGNAAAEPPENGETSKPAPLPRLIQQGATHGASQGASRGAAQGAAQRAERKETGVDENGDVCGKDEFSSVATLGRVGTGRSLLDVFISDLPEIGGHLDAVMAALSTAEGGGGAAGGVGAGDGTAAATAWCKGGVSADNAACAAAAKMASATSAHLELPSQPPSNVSPPHTPVQDHVPGFAHVHEKLLAIDEECNNGEDGEDHDDEDDRLSTGSIDSVDAAAAAAAAAALAMRTRRREAEETKANVLSPRIADEAEMKRGAGQRPPPLMLPGCLAPPCEDSPLSLGSPFNDGEASTWGLGASTPGRGGASRLPGVESPNCLSPQGTFWGAGSSRPPHAPPAQPMGANGGSPCAMTAGLGSPFPGASSGRAGGDDMDEWMPRSRGRKDRQVAGGRIKARSMAERQRRERISEGLQKLRMAVRGHGDTATMLDNAVAYVDALQRRVSSLETTLLLHRASCQHQIPECTVQGER